LLLEKFKFAKYLVHWEDGPRTGRHGRAREIIAAVDANGAEMEPVGTVVHSWKWEVTAAIVDVTETLSDNDDDRLAYLAHRFRNVGEQDALVLELPQRWVFPEATVPTQVKTLPLDPGSVWLEFFRCWGLIASTEIFFRTADCVQRSAERRIHLVVQFADRACLLMCFAFLYGRSLQHGWRC
jgi:hypothetical protein